MGADDVYVFDACAVIALLQDEPGAAVVDELLEDHRCLIHSVNACEVYYDLVLRDGAGVADGLEDVLEGYGFELKPDMSSGLWRSAGQLKAQWRRVSLADCFALALTVQEGGTLVTSDHHELDRLAQENVCPILFIR